MDIPSREARLATIHRHFEKPLLGAAVLSIPTTILQFSHVSETLRTLGEVLNWSIWLAFLAELATMLTLTPDRVRYLLLNPIDVAIVVFTPPFLGSAIQSVRVLRYCACSGCSGSHRWPASCSPWRASGQPPGSLY